MFNLLRLSMLSDCIILSTEWPPPGHMILPTLRKSTEKKGKQERSISTCLSVVLCSVRNQGKCTLNCERKALNKHFDFVKNEVCHLNLMGFLQNVFWKEGYLILPVSFWFNSATKNMSQLINKHVQYSGWQTAMKVVGTCRIKTFYSYKTTQWLHISQKIFPWSRRSMRIPFVSARNTSPCKVIYKWINITDREGREVDTFFFLLFQVVWLAGMLKRSFDWIGYSTGYFHV